MLDFFKAIRTVNVLLVCLAQLLLLNRYDAISRQNIFIIVLSVIIVVLGNIDNNIQDYNLDLKLKKKRENKFIKWLIGSNCFILFEMSFLILTFAFAIYQSSYFLLLAIPTYGILKLYNKYFKKLPAIGNFSVAILCAASLYVLDIPKDKSLMLLIGIIFFLTILRELIKDKEDEEADSAAEYRTLAIIVSIQWFMVFCIALTAVSIYFIYLYMEEIPIFLILSLDSCFILVLLILKKKWRYSSLCIKSLILLGVLTLIT